MHLAYQYLPGDRNVGKVSTAGGVGIIITGVNVTRGGEAGCDIVLLHGSGGSDSISDKQSVT